MVLIVNNCKVFFVAIEFGSNGLKVMAFNEKWSVYVEFCAKVPVLVMTESNLSY